MARSLRPNEVLDELQNDEDSCVSSSSASEDDMEETFQDTMMHVPNDQDTSQGPWRRPDTVSLFTVRSSGAFAGGRSRPRGGRSRPPRGQLGYSRVRQANVLTRVDHQALDEAAGWSYVPSEQPLHDPVFEQQVGVSAPVNEHSTQYDCFKLFCSNDFYKLVKTETNRYAGQMKVALARKGALKPHSILANWKPVTITDLKIFFAIILHMTVVHKGTIDEYWSRKVFLHTPFASKVMSRNRFRAIYACLHLNNNSNYIPRGADDYDAFFKLRPYFNMLSDYCHQYYKPAENLTIDEGTCGYRGRIHFRVFNKDKPDKYGMKIYMLCDSETGYALKMVPYIGDSKSVSQIVLELTEEYLHKWHTVYMDRFFTSPTVADVLWDKDTRLVGVVMLNRKGLPQHWRRQQLEVSEMTFCHRGPLTACKWHDKRDVPLLSTKHGASWTQVTAKSKRGPIQKIKPDCILDYNINKVGVDLNDQYVSYYSFKRKSMKWWKKMFFHLFARGTVNAYIIYNKSRPTAARKGFEEFIIACGEALAEDGGVEGQASTSTAYGLSGSSSRLFGRHFSERIPPNEKKQTPARVCKVCADVVKKSTGTRGRKETVFYCPDCNIPLCIPECFKKFHTQKDYTI